MMNFNVKYHFSHALMHCLRRERELERGSIIIACKNSILQLVHVHSEPSFYVATLTHPWIGTHPTDPQPGKHILQWSFTFKHFQVHITPIHMEEV